MNPYVALAIANASRGFGEAMGAALGESLFGGRDRGLEDLARRLDEIIKALQDLSERLAYLISLVEALPELILRDNRRLSAAESREYLRSARDLV